MKRKNGDAKEKPETSNEKAIRERRMKLRGGMSVRQVSRDQWELDRKGLAGSDVPIRNRKSWARDPGSGIERIG